jgi:glycopeptide antibiotics resistance protein
MRQINKHLKHVMGIKKTKQDKNRNAKIIMITWSVIGIVAVVLWAVVYKLISQL